MLMLASGSRSRAVVELEEADAKQAPHSRSSSAKLNLRSRYVLRASQMSTRYEWVQYN